MQQLKRWITLALLVFSLVLVTACGASLQKPTGLEDDAPIESVVEQDSDIVTDENEEGDEEGLVADEETSDAVEESDSEKAVDTVEKADTVVEKREKSTSNKSKTESNKQSDKKSTTANKNTNKSTSNAPSKKNNKPKSNTQSSDKKSNESKQKENNKGSTPSKNGSSSSNKKPTPQPKKDTVTISIVISSSEVPLGATSVEIEEGDKVLDPFVKISKARGIQYSVRGGGSSAYIEGIANVYEFDRGQGSGWMYRINGVFPDRGVGAVPVQNGDRIEFLYTTDLGKDLGANLQPFRR